MTDAATIVLTLANGITVPVALTDIRARIGPETFDTAVEALATEALRAALRETQL